MTPAGKFSLSRWFASLFGRPPATALKASITEQEARVLRDFSKAYGLDFQNSELLKRALTHRSYLSVTGGMAHESNERLEFLGDSVLGLVTSEHMFRTRPGEHEGQLTKTKSLLVSKAILSRRALAMGLGRFLLLSHSEIESGGRQRLSILADAFESVIGAVYLDLGFEASRAFIDRWLLQDAPEIVADKRHVNYKSHLQEYVQSAFRTHPVYRIRSEMGPDHSKHFMVEVSAGRRVLGEGRGRNKKEAEQAAARQALDGVTEPGSSEAPVREGRDRERHEPRVREARERPEPGVREAPRRDGPAAEPRTPEQSAPKSDVATDAEEDLRRGRRRGRRGGRGRRRPEETPQAGTAAQPAGEIVAREVPGPVAEISGGDDPRPASGRGPVREARIDRPRAIERPRGIERPREIERPRGIERPRAIERPREIEPPPPAEAEDEFEEVGRPEGPFGERLVDPYMTGPDAEWESEGGVSAGPTAESTPAEREESGIATRMERPARRGVPEPERRSQSATGDAEDKGPKADEPGGAGRDEASSYGRRPGRGRRRPFQK